MRLPSARRALALGPLALLAPLALVTLAIAAARPAPAAPAAAPAVDEELHELMEGLKANLKPLARTLMDPTRDEDSLAHLAEMQRLALQAKLLAPANLDEIAAGERAEHAKGFRRDMALLVRELVDMELHVLDGARGAAAEAVRTKLFQLREEAHGRYQAK